MSIHSSHMMRWIKDEGLFVCIRCHKCDCHNKKEMALPCPGIVAEKDWSKSA